MIPEFDGTSRHKLQEFLNACTYAEMQDFERRDIQTFDELKHQLETCYQTKQSTTHLQIEFNLLKQKLNEIAHAFGRVDLIAMKLYDSMIEGEKHPAHSKRTIHKTIKKQALINFQIKLRDELKVLVHAQRYTTLQETIKGASFEMKFQCFKCGKNSHYGRDYRSRYALSKPERSSRINTINKYCKYCKKAGHNREECWSLNRRPRTHADKSKENNKKPNEKIPESKRPPPKNELLLVTIPMRQIKNKEIQMLYESGSTISLIKLKHLKDDTPIQKEKIALTGVTGHKIYTIGKIDDIPIEYEGILGIDFLCQHSVICDYKYNQLKIGNAVLNFHPFNKIILKPRNETIIKARTDQNRIGIVRAEEKAPGIYIGNCIVNAADYICPVSVINTTDKEVEMQTSLIALEEIESDTTSEMYTIHTRNNLKPKISRNAHI
ncbi:hypothetical protein ACFW04_012495 [Cataglyphis niger]